MKVKATKNFEMVIDNEVGRKRTEGEVWEVTEERLAKLLSYKNGKKVLVEVIEEEKPKKNRKKK